MLPDVPEPEQAMKLAAREVAELAKPMLGSPAKELSELIADRVRFWRWKSAIRIMGRAKEIREGEGIQKNGVSLKFFLPFVEEVSKESEIDDEISEMWAHLLVRADKSTTGFDLMCLDLMSSIGAAEAVLLKKIFHSSHLSEFVKGKAGQVLGSRYELQLKRVFTDDELRRIGTGSQFISTLECIIVNDFELPATRIFSQQTNLAEKFSYSILTLDKMELIAGDEYRRALNPRRPERLAIVDTEFYSRLFQQAIGRRSERDDGRFDNYIGEMPSLSAVGRLFVQRCIAGPQCPGIREPKP